MRGSTANIFIWTFMWIFILWTSTMRGHLVGCEHRAKMDSTKMTQRCLMLDFVARDGVLQKRVAEPLDTCGASVRWAIAVRSALAASQVVLQVTLWPAYLDPVAATGSSCHWTIGLSLNYDVRGCGPGQFEGDRQCAPTE